MILLPSPDWLVNISTDVSRYSLLLYHNKHFREELKSGSIQVEASLSVLRVMFKRSENINILVFVVFVRFPTLQHLIEVCHNRWYFIDIAQTARLISLNDIILLQNVARGFSGLKKKTTRSLKVKVPLRGRGLQAKTKAPVPVEN